MEKEPKTFSELVSMCCWQVIQGITTGQRLESVMHIVLQYAIRWHEDREKEAKAGQAKQSS